MDYQNLYETLEYTAKQYPNKIGIVDEKEQITYKILKDRADSLAVFLRQTLGMMPGSSIGALMENNVHYVELIYAAAKIGISVLLLNVKLHEKEIEYIVKDTGIDVVMTQEKIFPKIKKLVDRQVIHTVLSVEKLSERVNGGLYLVQDILANASGTVACRTGNSATVAVLYTSGTSGHPKGVEISQKAVLETVKSYKEILRMDETEVGLLAVPIFHVTGFSCILALFVYLGGLLVMLPSFHSESTFQAIDRFKVTHFHAVPTLFQMLLNKWKKGYCLKSLRTAVCGGGYIEDAAIEQFCQIAPNVTFHPAYGMTESAGGGVLFPQHYLLAGKRGSAGKVMDNCEIGIMGDDGALLPAREVGQIVFQGDMVVKHYLHGVDKTHFRNGWLMSGDIGYLDEDRYVYVIGRKKAMINRGGEKIYSRFVEREIALHPDVAQCAVFPVKDCLFGEVPAAVIVPKKGKRLDAGMMRRHLERRIQKNKIPEFMEFWDELPCTASGKVKIAYLIECFNQKYQK